MGRVEWTADLAAANTQRENDLVAEQNKRDRVGAADDFATLCAEMEGGDVLHISKAAQLATLYSHIRRVRRDGSCFIRGYLYGVAEVAARDTAEAERIVNVIKENKDRLVGMFGEHLEDFHRAALELFTDIKDKKVTPTSSPSLHDRFQDDMSDYVAYYGRFAASLHIQTNAILFEPYLELDAKTYCQTTIETGGEFEQVPITALTQFFNVPVCIEYFDLSEGHGCTQHTIPDDAKSDIFLLYRPGHYDVLIPKDK